MVDWLKASAASLAKLNEVGTKVYNIGLADSKQIKVNKHNLLSQNGSTSNRNNETDLKKSAWGSNSSIPELLRKQNERIHQNKKIRPSSAVVRNQNVPTKTRQRPQSAKELNSEKHKKPPSGLGVKGTHRGLEERPPGGIGVGAGAGWSAPPGGILDMTGAEIDDVLNQVSQNQCWQANGKSGTPQPPRGSPDFSHMLNSQGTTFGDLVEGLFGEDSGGALPSEILYRPPPEPIHVTMPSATLDADEEDETEDNNHWHMRSSVEKPPTKTKVNINLNEGNSFGDDAEPWDDFLETDEESNQDYDEPRRRCRVVTFNEERNETTLITPRGKKKGDLNDTDADTHNIHQTERLSTYDKLEDYQLQKSAGYSSQTNPQLPKPKNYAGRPELRHVKSKTDTGIVFNEAMNDKERHGSSRGNKVVNEEERTKSLPMVSVAYIDDMVPVEHASSKGTGVNTSQSNSKPKRRQNKEDIETMISKVRLSDDEESKNTDVVWASPGSQTTKYVSSGSKNYYELALDAKIARNRMQQKELMDEKKRTKTIKTLEFGDGEVVEHKVVSCVDTQTHSKKEYVLPKEARPQSALKKKTHDQSTKSNTDKNELNSETKSEDGLSSNKNSAQKTQSEKYDELTFDMVGTNLSLGGSRRGAQSNVLQDSTASIDRKKKLTSNSSVDDRPQSRQAFVADHHVDNTLPHKDKHEANRSKFPGHKKTPPKGESNLNDELYTDFENRRLKKPRAVSAPVRNGPTFVNGKLVEGGARISSSPYAEQPLKIRPHSASVLSEMKKRQASKGALASNVKINAKLSFREIKRNKSAVKALKKGILSEPRSYNEDKYYANYTRPPPKTFVPAIRRKRMEERKSAQKQEKESKEPEAIEIWTRKDDFEIETEGISDCKRLQDTLLEQGVPVSLETLTRALLPPNECALRGKTCMTSTQPSFPAETSRLLSKPSVWCPEEHIRLQRAKKAVQRAEQSLREQASEERNRLYLLSLSPGSLRKTKKKTHKKKK